MGPSGDNRHSTVGKCIGKEKKLREAREKEGLMKDLLFLGWRGLGKLYTDREAVKQGGPVRWPQMKAPIANPDNLSSVPGTHVDRTDSRVVL